MFQSLIGNRKDWRIRNIILSPSAPSMKEEHKESSLVSEKLNQEEKFWEKYQNNVLPAIKQALKEDWLNVRLSS